MKAERHFVGRTGWLRAAVLGANDGILSTGSLILGVAAASAGQRNLIITGLAAVVAGAMSMAAGEYVSVSSQSDSEAADLARERRELITQPQAEHRELAAIYVKRGVDPAVAAQVADQLMAHDALAAHAQDELGIAHGGGVHPVQAAFASAVSFSVGGSMPLLIVLVAPPKILVPSLTIASLAFLGLLGAVGAKTGGAPIGKAMIRVIFWGALAMATTTVIGRVVGASI